MTHEYPPDRAFDSVSISRVSALRDYGLTAIELRTSVPLTAHHPQDHALRRERVHQGVALPWLD